MNHRFVRMQRVKGKQAIEVAARHNLREIAAEHGGKIDPARVGENYVLLGPTDAFGVAKCADDLLAAAGVHVLRKDAVRALEIVVSLHESSDVGLQNKVFAESVTWAQLHFGAPVLSAVVHRDEAAPHCHILILPLVGGRMVGSKLYGYKGKLRAMLDSFDAQVGLPNGLQANKRASALERREMFDQVFAALQANSGLQDYVLAALLKPHYNNPASLADILDLPSIPKRAPVSQFIETMTRPVAKSRRAKYKSFKLAAVEAGAKASADNLKVLRDAARE